MSIYPATKPLTMRDLLPRLQAVLTASLLTGREARLSVQGRPPVAVGYVSIADGRAARVEMPFSAAEVEMLVEAVARCTRDEAASVPPWEQDYVFQPAAPGEGQ